LGWVFDLVVSRTSYRIYKEYAGMMLLIILGALAVVLIPGIGAEINNARRWFRIGSFLIQPAEFAKVVWVLFLACSLVKKQERIKQSRVSFWPHLILCGVMGALLLKEPDFGTTFMIAISYHHMWRRGRPVPQFFLPAFRCVGGFYRFVTWSRPAERITAFLIPGSILSIPATSSIQGLDCRRRGYFRQRPGAAAVAFLPPESYPISSWRWSGGTGLAGILLTCFFLLLFRTGLQISRQAPIHHGASSRSAHDLLLAPGASQHGCRSGAGPDQGDAPSLHLLRGQRLHRQLCRGGPAHEYRKE